MCKCIDTTFETSKPSMKTETKHTLQDTLHCEVQGGSLGPRVNLEGFSYWAEGWKAGKTGAPDAEPSHKDSGEEKGGKL